MKKKTKELTYLKNESYLSTIGEVTAFKKDYIRVMVAYGYTETKARNIAIYLTTTYLTQQAASIELYTLLRNSLAEYKKHTLNATCKKHAQIIAKKLHIEKETKL